MADQNKEAYLRSLKTMMTDCLRRANKKEFAMLIEKELPAFHFRQVRAPIVDEKLLEQVKKVVDSINNYENKLKKLEDTDVQDREMFLYDVVEYVRSLNELVKQSKLSADTSKLIDIDAIELVMEILRSDIGNTPVDDKRYAALSKYFLQDVLLKLQVCVSRQKQLTKAGLLYRVIRNRDFEGFINCFHPSLANVPCGDSPSPLFCAVHTNALFTTICILNHCQINADVDANHSNVLHYAARYRDASLMKSLLMHIPKETVSALINMKNSNMQTPLHVAAEGENYKVVQVLCQYGACYNTLDGKNRTPAMLCPGHEGLTGFFEDMETTFQLAREGKCEEVEDFARSSDHDTLALLNADNDKGMTPFDVLMDDFE